MWIWILSHVFSFVFFLKKYWINYCQISEWKLQSVILEDVETHPQKTRIKTIFYISSNWRNKWCYIISIHEKPHFQTKHAYFMGKLIININKPSRKLNFLVYESRHAEYWKVLFYKCLSSISIKSRQQVSVLLIKITKCFHLFSVFFFHGFRNTLILNYQKL